MKDNSSFQEYHCKNILTGPVNTVLGGHMHAKKFWYTNMPQEKQEQTKKKLLQNGIDQLLLLKKKCKKRCAKWRIGKGKSKRLEMVHSKVILNLSWISWWHNLSMSAM